MKETMPWMDEYKLLGIPDSFMPYPEEPVYHILEHAAKKYKRNGLIQFDYKMTYPELKDKVDRLATAFFYMGLKKGDRVATILPTSIQFVIADYAISRAGLIHVPCSSLEPVDTLEHKFKEGTPRLIISLAQYDDIVLQLLKRTDVEFLILSKLEDYASMDIDLSEYEDVSSIKGAAWMSNLINNTPAQPPEIDFDVVEDIETLLFTGGTTGLPKGCMLTHRNIYANSIQTLHALGQAGIILKGSVSVLLGLPFFHSYGHVILHSMMLFGFNQILIPDPRDTSNMVKMIKTHYPLLQFGVPTQFMKMSDELKGIGILGISGSAPLSKNTQKNFEKKSGGGIMEGYGLSEMSPTTHLNTTLMLRLFGGRKIVKLTSSFLKLKPVNIVLNFFFRLLGTWIMGRIGTKLISFLVSITGKEKSSKRGEEKRGTIGVPYPDTIIKVIDIDSGREMSYEELIRGATGELLLKGPQRMKGYWPEKGSGFDEEGFIHTSDIVKINEKGYFYIVDRTKDMVIVSGYKVYSKEIDDILCNHPQVNMAATVGISDPEREGSERIAVYIEPVEEFKETIDENKIIELLKSKVAKYAVPKFIKFIDKMPLTEVQKVDKKEIRKMAESEFGLLKKSLKK